MRVVGGWWWSVNRMVLVGTMLGSRYLVNTYLPTNHVHHLLGQLFWQLEPP